MFYDYISFSCLCVRIVFTQKRCMLHNEASNHYKAKMGISVNAEPEVPEFGPFGGKH